MSDDKQENELLLTAYLDGELGDNQASIEKAERLIRDNSQYAELVEQWRESGAALRSLPKYKLESGFADRVLASIDSTADSSTAISKSSTSLGHSGATSDASSHFSGLLAIAALAAMLLLTLFVFPAFQKSDGPVAENPIAQPESVPNEKPDTPRQPIVRQPRAMSMENGNNVASEVVTVPESSLPSNQPFVEQVMWVKLNGGHTLDDVKKTLASESIKLSDSEIQLNQADVQAIYAIALPDRMRSAITQLTEDLSAEVTAFQMPLAVQNGIATPLVSQRLRGDHDQSEIDELDRWFGLADDEDGIRPVRYLLLFGQ